MNNTPHPTTVDMAFQALQDTMSGTEGLKLTHAQHYMEGVLQSEGALKRLDGNEGLFSAIGSGLQKIWEYIKKMFAWIFGSGTDKAASTAKASEAKIDNIAKKVDAIGSGNLSGVKIVVAAPEGGGEPSPVVKKVASEMSKNTDTPEVTITLLPEHVKQLEEKHAGKGTEPTVEEIKELVKTQVKNPQTLNSRQKEKLKELADRYVIHVEAMTKLFAEDHSAKFEGTEFVETFKTFKDGLNDRSKNMSELGIKLMSDSNDLFIIQPIIRKEINSIGGDITFVTMRKSEVSSRLASLEKTVTKIETKNPDSPNLDKFKKDVEAAKVLIMTLSNYIVEIEKFAEFMGTVSDTTAKLFGVQVKQ